MTIRASKENAERALQIAKRGQSKGHVSRKNWNDLVEFLTRAKAKLPTEEAFDNDAKRKRNK